MMPLKGVKVGVRNVDPDKDIEELKTKIRDHPELNLVGYMLSEFSLRRKGGIELPVGGIVSSVLHATFFLSWFRMRRLMMTIFM